MISLSATWKWLNDPLNWQQNATGPGIPAQLLSHLLYSVLALAIAAVIAVPIGLAIGHGRRGSWLVSGANALRALPTTGLLILLYVIIAPHIQGRGVKVYLIPTEIVLVLLAIPPLLANTYAGIQNVSVSVRDAAKGMGMTGSQVLWRVEVPNALPLMFSGLRGATLQVIATATVAAYVGLDGLGRYVYDGLSQRDFPQMVSGGLLVAILALLVDFVLAMIQRFTVSPGVTGRRTRTRRRRVAPDARSAAVEELEAVPA